MFPPEPATALNAVPLTQIQFSDPNNPGGLVNFTPPRCPGTVALDSNLNRIIAEVLQENPLLPPGSGDYPFDQIDVLGEVFPDDKVEYACIIDHREEYLGPAANGEMQIRQTILFWGDIRWNR